jgi:putative endonuclease
VYYVYAIKSRLRDRIYIGQTQDLGKRLQYHNAGYVNSTAIARPWSLIAKQEFMTRDGARWVERELKRSKGKRERWMIRHAIDDER